MARDLLPIGGSGIWVGFHRKIGIVIFDPTQQLRVPAEAIRLWEVRRSVVRLFDRAASASHIMSLTSFLRSSGLSPKLIAFGAAGMIAREYLANRPDLPSQPPEREPSEPQVFPPSIDMDDEHDLIFQEFFDDQEAWARSEEQGWFYED